MGVKVEGVRADERVAIADTTVRNRRLLIGGSLFVVIVVVLGFVIYQATKPVPTYGPVGHQFRINFGGSATQAGASQVGSFQATSGVTGVQSWRFGNSSTTETVEVENIPSNDPFLIDNGQATNLLLQELPGSHPVTISGLSGVELLSTKSSTSLSGSFPYTETAVLLQNDTQFIITASGTSQSGVQAFVNSFRPVS